MEQLRFPVNNQLRFAAGFCVCLSASSGSKHVDHQQQQIQRLLPPRYPNPLPACMSSFICVSLQDRPPAMMIKGLSLFQTSAVVGTKCLGSGVCIKVHNWEACKLPKSVSCNFSDSKEGVCNENGWLSRILKATGGCSQTHPTLQEVEHALSQ